MKSRILSVALVIAAMMLSTLPAAAGNADSDLSDPSTALFEGQVIDLAEGWGEAQACLDWGSNTVVECFRSETELLDRVSELEASASTAPSPLGARSSTCSSSLKLYDGYFYTGSALYLYRRSTWVNLSSYGWANRASSFKVGACSSYFADYSNGGGSWYPTSGTQAWDVASIMQSGWNNRVSSIYIT